MVRLTDRPDIILAVYRGRKTTCTTIHRYPIFSTRYFVMCKVYTGHHGTSMIKHGLCNCTVNNPLAKARGLSLHTGAQTMLYLSHEIDMSVESLSFESKQFQQCKGLNFKNKFSFNVSSNIANAKN